MNYRFFFFTHMMLFLFALIPVYGAGYTDNHNDGSLSGWTTYGNRTWSESDGYALPNHSDQNDIGFCINNYSCTDDGTFTCTIKGSGNENSLDGGVVFRFTDMTHFYFVSIAETNANGHSPDNSIRMTINSTDARSDSIVIKDNLDFTGLNSVYTIAIRLSGSTFTFWLNGDSLAQYTDVSHSSGSVGYAYDDLTDRYVSMDYSSWVDAINDYTWDTSPASGIQAGSGIWGSNDYWTVDGGDGTNLTSWVAGRTATFSGTDGTYAVTVSSTQSVDSLSFLNTTYTLSGGTINLGTHNAMYVASDKTAIIGSVISGSSGLSLYGSGTLTLTGTNTYTGTTLINSGTINIGNGGAGGTITGQIENNGICVYNRTGIDSITSIISGTGSFEKTGSGTLVLSADNTYTGTTTITSGTLIVNGTTTSGSTVSVLANGTLGGNGTIAGSVSVNGGTISPGFNGTGTLSTGLFMLSSASHIQFDLGTVSDTIAVSGALTLDGTISISAANGFLPGTYRIITYTGAINDNTLDVGSTPSGWDVTIEQGSGYVSAVVSAGLIQTEPGDTLAAVGNSVSFSVSAVGEGTITYTWLRYPSDSIGNTATLSLSSVTLADTGARFRCVVHDDWGADSSRWAQLTVIDSPRIDLQPQNTSTEVGTQALFSLSVKDTATMTYSWRNTNNNTVLGTDTTFSINTVTFTDSGTRYFCLLTNSAATISSDTAELTVLHIPPVIMEQPVSYSAFAGDSVQFSITATGNAPPSYAWRKVPTDTILGTAASYTIPTAALTDSGKYYCIVSNPGGTVYSDTVDLTVRTPKPVPAFSITPKIGAAPLSVHFSDSSTEEIDSHIWKFGDGNTDSTKSPTHTYTYPGLYSVMLIVSGPGGTDSLVKFDSIFVYDIDANPIQIQARYLSGMDVEVTLRNIDSIDTLLPEPQCDAIGIWYRINELPTDTGNGLLIAQYTRSLFTESVLLDTITLPETTDSLFGLMSGLFWHDGTISEFMTGNGCTILLRDTTNMPVINPFTLSATALSSTSIRLSWNSLSDQSITNIRLWQGTSAIDTGIFSTYISFDSLSVTPDDTSIIVDNLTPLSKYYFGIQAGDGDEWSIITEQSRTSCTTLSHGNDTVNTIVIDTAYFDSLTGVLRLSWCLFTSEYPDEIIDAGITYDLSQYPSDSTGIYPVTMTELCTDTIVQLPESILFDTLYYIALWFRQQGGRWYEPTDSSRTIIRTGTSFRQAVTFFDTNSVTDTITAFNNSIVIWKDGSYTGSVPITTDTLEVLSLTSPPGMIVVGSPFVFKNGEPTLPFSIGFRINSLPNGRSLNDVRIYRGNTDAFSVVHETMIDAEHGIVSIKTNDLTQLFTAMIDTVHPQVTISSDTAKIITSTEPVTDTIRIDDNAANVHWNYLFSSGDKVPKSRYNGEIRSLDTLFTLIIPDTIQVISSTTGLRVLLVVDDGPHRDTINLSRSVYRYKSDVQTITRKQWTPIYATAQLKKKNISILIDQLKEHLKTSSYNSSLMRLFRWNNYSGTGNDTNRWTEYAPELEDISPLFSLEPGGLFWLKTHKDVNVHLDTGYTLSLKDTFSVTLPPKQWTDFGMPFHFGVRMQEILSAGNYTSDSVLYYQWKQSDSTTSTYALEPFYVAMLPDKHNRASTMEYLPNSGYSLYNNHTSKTVTVRIPPTLPDMGKKLQKSATSSDPSWSTKFIVQSDNGIHYPAVYFGYSPKVTMYPFPLTPSFSPLRLAVFDPQTTRWHGHYISKTAKNGLAQELRIDNQSDTIQTIQYHFEQTGMFPDGYTPYCYDPETKRFSTTGTISVTPASTMSCWIIVGDTTYRQHFTSAVIPQQYSLHVPYLNPSGSMVHIRYTVPFGAKEHIHIGIYNIKGAQVWEQTINNQFSAGTHIVTWKGNDSRQFPVGAGFYIIRLTVLGNNGKPIKQFARQTALLR